MKKLLATFGAILLGLSLTSCGKKIDSSNWISTLADGKTAAKKENKKIILRFSAEDSDGISERLSANLFKTEEFLAEFSEKYILVNIDFSNSRFDLMAPNPEDENSNSKETEKLRDQLNLDMKLATLYGVEAMPSYMLLTKEGYVVADLEVEEDDDIDAFRKELEDKKVRIDQVDELLGRIRNGKKDDVIKAIDELYMSTEINHRVLISDFSEKLVQMDKKNESGLAVKHVFAMSDAKAQVAILEEDYEKAAEALVEPAKYDWLPAEDLQQVYYTTGYFIAQSGSTDYAKIKDYFQEAYDAAPESEHAESIKEAIGYVAKMMAADTEGPAAAPAEQVVPGEPSADTNVETTN